MTGLSPNDVTNVTVSLAPTAVPTRNFGALLLLGASDVIDTTERLRQYARIEDVLADFGTVAPEYLAALDFFSQRPQPALLYIGRWAKGATKGVLHGAALNASQQALATFTAITAGGFTITIDGTARTISGVNLSGAASLAGVAALVQTALSAWATVTWDAQRSRFDVKSLTTGSSSTVAAPGASALATAMGLVSGTAVAGIIAETLVSGVGTFLNLSNAWYGLVVADTAPVSSDHLAVAALIEAASPARLYGVTSTDANCAVASSTTDLAYQLKAAGYERTVVQYSSSDPYAVASLIGRAFTVDFTANNSAITLMFKQEPGVIAETLTETQAAALKAKNCNAFVNYDNGAAIIQPGTMADGTFFDERHGADWLANAVQVAVFDRLYQSPTKVPQTDAGMHLLLTTVEFTLSQAVANGLVGPGTWTSELEFGALKSGDYLPKGFYVYAAPLAQQAQSDREARKAPTIQAAIKLAGAVHSANVAISANR